MDRRGVKCIDRPTGARGRRRPFGALGRVQLTRTGHSVTIVDSGSAAGGMMRFGIRSTGCRADVLDAEVQRILDMGVVLELNHKVTDLLATMQDGGFDAVFLAIGAHIGKRAYIPAGDSTHILDAVSMLRGMEGKQPPMLGRRVIVYGGGNTAMDAARTAKRLGATDAVVVYRRTRDRMPAHDFEVEEALDEGVTMKWLSTITQGRKVAGCSSRRWSWTPPASRSPPANSRSSKPTPWSLRWVRKPTCRCSKAFRASRSRTTSSR